MSYPLTALIPRDCIIIGKRPKLKYPAKGKRGHAIASDDVLRPASIAGRPSMIGMVGRCSKERQRLITKRLDCPQRIAMFQIERA